MFGPAAVIEVTLYALAAVGDFYAVRRSYEQGHTGTMRLAALLGGASVLRCFWVAAREEFEENEDERGWEDALRVINRMSMLLQFTAYSGMVVFWENLRHRFDPNITRSQRLWNVVLVANVLLYVGILVTSCIDSLYSDNIVAIAVSFAVVAAFVAYGALQLRRLLESARKALANNAQIAVAVRKLNVISGTTSLLFAVRCLVFLYEPVTGDRFEGSLGDTLYPWVFYELPELAANFVIVGSLCYSLPCYYRGGDGETEMAATAAHTASTDSLLRRPTVAAEI